MTITTLNHGADRRYSLQCTPRELSILISSMDYTLAGIEDTGTIPESLVPATAKNKPDPAEEEFGAVVRQTKMMQAQCTAVCPNWREL